MHLPLLFSFKQLVFGNGYLAGVRMSGRALLEEEGSEFWITGVAPVGLAGGGADRNAACTEFRKAWAEILFDIAQDAPTFDAFKRECEVFLAGTTTAMTAEWEAALQEVRRTNYVDPALRREQCHGQEVEYEVVDLSGLKFEPARNEAESGLEAAA